MLVLEHKPVYTLGRSAKAADLKFPLDAPEQGNEATHGCEVGTHLWLLLYTYVHTHTLADIHLHALFPYRKARA